MSRTEEFGAISRGQTFVYNPQDLTLVRDKCHPLYDPSIEDPVSEDFVRNIMLLGVIEPVVVRKNGFVNGKPNIEVVNGRTRVRAAMIANERLVGSGMPPKVIPAVYRSADDPDAMTMMIALNEQRKFEDHVTRAEKLKRYLESGFTENQAKDVFALTGGQIKLLLQVLEMAKDVKLALREKRITLDIAKRLSLLPRDKQVEALKALLELMPKPRGTEAKEMVDQKIKEGNHEDTSRPKSKSYKKVQAALEEIYSMADSDFKNGIMQALRWILGEEDPAWTGQSDKKKPGRPRKEKPDPISDAPTKRGRPRKEKNESPKRGRGRPKGSKNKPQEQVELEVEVNEI